MRIKEVMKGVVFFVEVGYKDGRRVKNRILTAKKKSLISCVTYTATPIYVK